MDPISLMAAQGAAGASADPLYVEDVFSTYLYNGTGSTQSIDNNIDLDAKGGLVWIKMRATAGYEHILTDTERGAQKYLSSNNSSVEQTGTTDLTAFNSDGFTIGSSSRVNRSVANENEFVSWSFRKAPGFFDVVTWTGDGTSGRTVAHSLGSVPGCIMIKCTSHAEDWVVYHRSIGAQVALRLSTTAAQQDETFWFNDTAPTSSVFTLGNSGSVNDPSRTYVAYLFAHDDTSYGTDSDEAIIKCGSYTGTGSAGNSINLGFEPQWVMVKASSGTGNWVMQNTMTGMNFDSSGNGDSVGNGISANSDAAESGFSPNILATSTGFKLLSTSSYVNSNSTTYVYMAIRRPHKPPTAGTEVFAIDNQGTGTMPPQYHSNFVVDWAFTVAFAESQTYRYRESFTRIQGKKRNKFNITEVEANYSSAGWDYMDGFHDNNSSVSTTYGWMFKRAPGFFDVVAYEGTGSATTITHNLKATPSVVLIKGRDTTYSWYWQHYALGANTWLQLNNDEVKAANGNLFNSTLPTSSVFSVGTLSGNNQSTKKYMAYLFADLAGISKAGTYSGTGNDVDVDCGFDAGARFVLIKRADSSGDWYAWDSTRGIVSGNDPYFFMNTDDVEVTSTDYIDPLNAGFTVTSSAPVELNANGGTYAYLAIA